MATERIYQSIRGETGLTDVVVSIYNSSGTEVINDAACTELSSTGIYYYDYVWTTSGKFLALFTSSTMNFQAYLSIQLGISVSTYVPTTSVTYIDVRNDVGMVYNMVDIATTSTVITQIIGTAEEDIKLITSTTTGYKQAIRYLSDAYVVNHVLSGAGPESGTEPKLINMRDEFIDRVKTTLRRQGKDYENIVAAMLQIN